MASTPEDSSVPFPSDETSAPGRSDPPAGPPPPAADPGTGTGGTGPGRGRGRRGRRLVRHFKLDAQLAPHDRPAYEALLLDPRQTVDSLLKWLHDRGYDVSRGGVHRHRRKFEEDVLDIRKDAAAACHYAALARAHGGPSGLADAGQFRLEQLFVEQLFRMKKGDERAAKEWLDLGRAMAAVLDNRRAVEASKPHRGLAKKPFDGVAVANAVRRRFGVPPPPEPAPGTPTSPPEPRDVCDARRIEIADEARRQPGAPPLGGGEFRPPPPPSENQGSG